MRQPSIIMIRRINNCCRIDWFQLSTGNAPPTGPGRILMMRFNHATIQVWLNGILILAFLANIPFIGLQTAYAADEAADAAAVRQYNLAVGLQNKKLYAQAGQRWAAFI